MATLDRCACGKPFNGTPYREHASSRPMCADCWEYLLRNRGRTELDLATAYDRTQNRRGKHRRWDGPTGKPLH